MRRMARRPTRMRTPVRITTVIGETLILCGIATLGYIVWQPWHTTIVVQGEQRELATQVSESWDTDDAEAGEPQAPAEPGTIPVVAQHADTEDFAVMHIPAFATQFINVLSEGVSEPGVLNVDEKGIGRYSNSQNLGEPGNTAFAAHRSGAFTAPFRETDALRVGDPIFIETPEGWYIYRFRSAEYVWPNETDVLNPFPRIDGTPGDDRILTFTSCHPKNLGISERLIAYSVFESFSPRADGIPAELLELNPSLADDTGGA